MAEWHLRTLLAGFVGCEVGGQHASLMYVGMIREIFNIDTDDQVEAVVPVFRTADLVTLAGYCRAGLLL